MKTKKVLILSLASWVGVSLQAHAQTTKFTYQGQLTDNGSPANGVYDLRFTIYDVLTGGSVVGGPVTNAPTSVSNGLFVVTLDFGAGVFSGGDRWLDIGVRTNGSASDYQVLSPRQQFTSTPYAIRAATFSGAISDSQLSPNVARLNANQAFTGTNLFLANVDIGTGISTEVLLRVRGAQEGIRIQGPTAGASHIGYISFADLNGTPVGYLGDLSAGDSSMFLDAFNSVFLRPKSGDVVLETSGGRVLTATASGNVGIRTSSPQAALHVRGADAVQLRLQNQVNNEYWNIYSESFNNSGNLLFAAGPSGGYAWIRKADGVYFSSSDGRLKRDITSLGHVLHRVLQLRPVAYHLRAEPEKTPRTFGLIAQEVEPVFPEVVGEYNGMKSLAYSELVPVTVRAIQELNQKLEDKLQEKNKEIQELRQSVAELKELVGKLAEQQAAD